MPRNRGLGKGLSALIPEGVAAPVAEERPGGVQEIPLSAIVPNPYQPRRRFRESGLQELAASIRVHGVVEPVVVRPLGGEFQLVSGERRVRAARLAGLASVPAVVRACDEREMAEVALVENLQREDLSPVEEASAYQRLVEEFGWTQEAIGEKVGKSRSHVANLIRLLQLPASVLEALDNGQLSAAHGKVLLSVAEEERSRWASLAIEHGWSVAELSHRIEAAGRSRSRPEMAQNAEVHLESMAAELRRRIGLPVQVKGSGQRGRVEIRYSSLAELERLVELLSGDDGVDEDFVV
ncbi:MAG: ParB/RepB/Spo0J family partition protein [Firmicutes bacterium]|nr:ParB/RepB/Spo0J family partition protein [Bacillota bacterium]